MISIRLSPLCRLESSILEFLEKKEKEDRFLLRFSLLRRVIVGETDRKESDTIRQECGTRLEIEEN